MDEIDRLTRLCKMCDFCLNNFISDSDDHSEPLHPGEEEWLMNAINNVHIVPSDRLNTMVLYLFGHVFSRENDDNVSGIISVLNELKDVTEDIDNAKNFIQLGGLDIIVCLLDDRVVRLRYDALELLGIINQNNYVCQTETLNKDVIEKLIRYIQRETDVVLLNKLIFALSCSVRGHMEAFLRFVRCDGFELMLIQLQSSSPQTRCKITFFISSLCAEMDINELNSMTLQSCLDDFVDFLLGISSFFEPEIEYVLGSIYSIMTRCPSMNVIKKTHFKNLLYYQKTLLNNLHGAQEVNFYITEISFLLNKQLLLLK